MGMTRKKHKEYSTKKRLVRSDNSNMELVSIPVAVPSKVWVCARSLAEIEGSNPAGRNGYILGVLCFCQVEVSAAS